MSHKHISEESQRILLLIKLDATSLYDRITTRESEYLTLFALKRTREHFPEIFNNRYQDLGINDLKHCAQETIIAVDAFYNFIEKMYWYLKITEDMPNTVEDKLFQDIKSLKKLYERLCLYIDADLNPYQGKLQEGTSVGLETTEGENEEGNLSDVSLDNNGEDFSSSDDIEEKT